MGNTPYGPEYNPLPGINKVKAQYHRVQIAVGILPRGKSTDTRKILHKTQVESPVVSKYIHQMDCVTVTEDMGEKNGSGDTPSLVTRDSLPNKEICRDCDRVNTCILWLLAKGELDLKFLPEPLRSQVIIWSNE